MDLIIGSLTEGRRARSTRAARPITTTARGTRRGRGGGGQGAAQRIRANITNPTSARKWEQVLRPPATGVKFLIPTWVPVEDLTPDEQDTYYLTHPRPVKPSPEDRLSQSQPSTPHPADMATDTTMSGSVTPVPGVPIHPAELLSPADQEGGRATDAAVAIQQELVAAPPPPTVGGEEAPATALAPKHPLVAVDAITEESSEPPVKRAKIEDTAAADTTTTTTTTTTPMAMDLGRETADTGVAPPVMGTEASSAPNTIPTNSAATTTTAGGETNTVQFDMSHETETTHATLPSVAPPNANDLKEEEANI